MIRSRSSLILFGASLAFAPGLAAQDITVSDANVNCFIEFNDTPVVFNNDADFLRADPGGDAAGVLFKTAWAYRVSGDNQETIFNDGGGQAVYNSAGTTGTATWADVDGRGLMSAVCTYEAVSNSATSGYVTGKMAITNISGRPLTIDVFHLADFDSCGAAFGTNSSTTGSDGHQIVSSGSCAEFGDHSGFGADGWEVGSYTNTANPSGGACAPYASLVDLYTRLENAQTDDLRNDACDWGPVDVRGAYQWSGYTIPPGSTSQFNIALGHNTRTPAAECWLMLGFDPIHANITPGDVLLTIPHFSWPVTENVRPRIDVPNQPLLNGAHVYFQVFMLNPVAFPNDPIKLSNGVDVILGDQGYPYGPQSGMTAFPMHTTPLGGVIDIGFVIL